MSKKDNRPPCQKKVWGFSYKQTMMAIPEKLHIIGTLGMKLKVKPQDFLH